MTWDIDRLGKAASDAVRPAPTPGATLGKYRVIREIAGGAAGVVYEAEDPGLRRRVALKVLREVHGTSDVLRKRFEREAQAAAGLDHPNVLRVFDAGEDAGRMYLAMELVDGESLADRLARRPFERRPMLRLLVKAARGVAAAHAHGIVHRDVKPANILVTREHEPKVGDFGLARVMDAETTLTRSGTPMGTPLYMAPEQARGDQDAITPATDVYALGAILYEILTGRAPHTGQSATEIYGKILSTDPMPPRRQDPTIPIELETICLMALEADPARRYATAAEFADDLDRHLSGESILARPPGPVVRAVKWAGRHQAVTLGVVLSTVFIAAIIGILVVQVGKARRETAALQELELARPSIDQAIRALYRAGVDFVALRRELADARPHLRKAVELDPSRPLPHYVMGQSWELEGFDDRAEEEWRRAIALDAGFGPAHFQLGRMLAARSFELNVGYSVQEFHRRREAYDRTVAEARSQLDIAVKLGSGFNDRRQVEIAAALSRVLSSDLEGARQACEEAIGRYGSAEGVEEFLWLLGLASRGREQMEAYDRALRLCPHHARALWSRGTALAVAGRYAEAAADFGGALEVNPRWASAWISRANQRLPLNDLDGAIADCDEGLRLAPGSLPALTCRAIAKRLKKDLAGAIADYGLAIRIDPDFAPPYINRAAALGDAGRYDEARADFDRAIEIDPKYAGAHLGRAKFRWKLGDRDGAMKDVDRAIAAEPANPETWYTRATAEIFLELHDEAIRDLKKVVELAPPSYADLAEAKRLLKAYGR